MSKVSEYAGIQFIKGINEKDRPEIRLFRNNDGKKGRAVYKFSKPSTITLENLNSIHRMYMVDEEGELSTRKIELSIQDNNFMEVKSIYNWNSEKEFERFMRFAKRYEKSITNI